MLLPTDLLALWSFMCQRYIYSYIYILMDSFVCPSYERLLTVDWDSVWPKSKATSSGPGYLGPCGDPDIQATSAGSSYLGHGGVQTSRQLMWFMVYFSFSCMLWLPGQHPMDQVICDVEVSGQHPVDQVASYVGVFRHLGSILWIRLSVMCGCADIWATSHGSGCLWCGGFQRSGQHPVDLLVNDVMCRHLGNILWIWLSVM